MVEYRLITGERSDTLVRMVNEAIRDGWELRGHMQVIIVDKKFMTRKFYQPMIRVIEEQEG